MNKYNILTENDKQITQPRGVKVELMSHQKTMISKMLEVEETGQIQVKEKIKLNIEVPIKIFEYGIVG